MGGGGGGCTLVAIVGSSSLDSTSPTWYRTAHPIAQHGSESRPAQASCAGCEGRCEGWTCWRRWSSSSSGLSGSGDGGEGWTCWRRWSSSSSGLGGQRVRSASSSIGLLWWLCCGEESSPADEEASYSHLCYGAQSAFTPTSRAACTSTSRSWSRSSCCTSRRGQEGAGA